MMLQKIALQIAAGIGGLWLATEFVDNVAFEGTWQVFLAAGTILGTINIFIKPAVKLITLPLNILTLGLSSLVVNMLMVWAVDILFTELIIVGLISLFWTTLIVWSLSVIPSIFSR